MNERLTALLGALVSAALVYGVLVPRPAPQERTARPTSEETGPNGQLAARRWLEREGVAVHGLRERFDVLNREDHPAYGPGNLMLMAMPQLRHPREEEIAELREWVAAGNTLVVLAALNDTPGWSYQGDSDYFTDDLAALTGASFEPAGAEDDEADADGEAEEAPDPFAPLAEPLWHEVEVDPEHWLTRDAGPLAARSDLPTGAWEAEAGEESSLFVLGRSADDGRPALWVFAQGSGQVVLSAYGTLFANDVIGRGGNRRMLANLVRYHLAPGGVVIFDDMHQGLSSLYDPEAFFADPRLHRSILLALALWLLFAVFANGRLGALPRAGPARRQSDFVRATGHLLARKVRPADAGRRLLDNFLREAALRVGAPPGTEAVWDALAAAPLADPAALARLRRRARSLAAGRRVDLAAIHDDIVLLRRALH